MTQLIALSSVVGGAEQSKVRQLSQWVNLFLSRIVQACASLAIAFRSVIPFRRSCLGYAPKGSVWPLHLVLYGALPTVSDRSGVARALI